MLNIKAIVSKYVTGNLSSEKLPSLACELIGEGYDSPSLLILAGLSKSDGSKEIDKFFKFFLYEIGIPVPNIRRASLYYAAVLAEEILNGKRDVFLGIRDIKQQALDRFDFFSENNKYVYDSIYFEKVYGLFDQYDDLENSWVDSEQKIDEAANIKSEMLKALKEWYEKISREI